MANPQAENGHVDIANEIVEALWKVNLSSYETRVLWYLFRKTYGWKKKTDRIALSQFSKDIGIDRRLVHRAIKGLSSKKMIVIYKDDRGYVTYGFQKNYEYWHLSSKKMTVIRTDDKPVSKSMTKVSSKEIPTKEKKETIQKTKYGEFVELSDDEYQKLQNKFSNLSDIIDFFNLKIGSKGLKQWRKDHASDYMTILYWDRQGYIKIESRDSMTPSVRAELEQWERDSGRKTDV